jgi:hypothetical protein
MSIATVIYLGDVLSRFHNFVIALNFLVVIAAIFLLIAPAIQADLNSYSSDKKTYSEYFNLFWKPIKFQILSLIFIIVSSIFVPSKDTLYLMAASNVAEKMVESKDFKQLYQKSYDLLVSKIDEALKEKK